MPEGEKITPPKIILEPSPVKESGFRSVFAKLRKRRIIETLAAFIGGGWLLVEVVERLLVGHYKFPDETIDLTVVSVICALLATLVWRWFRGTEKRPGNIRVEVLLVPLIILATAAIDLNLILQIASIPGKKLLIGIIAICMAIIWIIFKLTQWAAAMPESRKKEIKVSELSVVRPEKSIVVLPFTDLSPQKDQDYFCDGMTEEIVADLSHVHELLVISRSSAMTFKGSSKTVRDIAKDLNIRYVMEGSVRKAGNDLRITAQLIDATNDAHLWAEKYSGTLDDVFDIQEKVSRSIVKALKLMLTSEEGQRIAEHPISDIRAYDFYLRHRQEIWKGSEESLDRALDYLQKGLAIIGENVLLCAGMANVYFQFYNWGIRTDELTLLKAEEYTNKVFALEPDSSYGHLQLGQILLFRGTIKGAFQHFKRAAESAPNDPEILLWLVACYACYFGKPALAAPLAQRAVNVDPLTAVNHWGPGFVYWMQGKLELALASAAEYCQMDPESMMAKWYYAQVLAWNKRLDEAYEVMNQLAKSAPMHSLGTSISFLKYALQGNKDEAVRAFPESAQKIAWSDFHAPWMVAECFALIDEREEAIRWLEHAVDRGWCNFPLFSDIDPFLANIRGEPRFKKLMERVKYEWEHFEV
jgi:non-specific serine/threonine protein kinase